MFSPCIGGAVRGSKLSNQRGNYSKLPLLSFYKVRKQRLGQGDGTKIVDLHKLAIHLKLGILDKGPLADASIVKQDVHLPKKGKGSNDLLIKIAASC